MNRTIGVHFITTVDELEKNWEDSQFELSSKYQYEGINKYIWDYYLVFCCNFNEEDLDKRLRFKIERDRFCCRKYFLFTFPQKNFSKHELISRIFPLINCAKEIQVIKPETIIANLDKKLQYMVYPDFFTEELPENEIKTLIETMISERKLKNE